MRLNPRRINLQTRSAGILLHPTSLPGPHGSGDLGPEAYRFIDFLAAAGVGWWQMLPTTPIGPGNSPYSSSSAFAGNPLLIDLRDLADQGLLDLADLSPRPGFRAERVNYAAVIRFRLNLLMAAYENFREAGGWADPGYRQFCADEAAWLDEFAEYETMRELYRGRPWTEWLPEDRDGRNPAPRMKLRKVAEDLLHSHKFVQFQYFRQWRRLRAYAERAGVGLIGDIPIFNDLHSVDVWAHPELYMLDGRGRPTALTGCPPDAFNRNGQMWGHPQYDWKAHARTGFAWWIDRFRHLLRQFDAARIDHFLGFLRVWWLPGASRTARQGRWVRSPGDALFAAVRAALGDVAIIAEDLGATTPAAFALRDKYGFPGMRVLQFGFGDDSEASDYHLPHSYPRNCVAYTGTHDNEPIVAWAKRVERAAKSGRRARGADGLAEWDRVQRYVGPSAEPLPWQLIRALYASPANLVVLPAQDILGLGAQQRMNIPGVARGNWEWRLPAEALTWSAAARLRDLAAAYGR